MSNAPPLHLHTGSTVVNPPPRQQPQIGGLLEYHRDLLNEFGEPVDSQALESGRNVAHVDLVDPLLDDQRVRAARPGLVLLAYALPDVHPFTTTAAYVNWRLGNQAASFAVSEQGLAAPFSALRFASAYGATGQHRSVVLAVLEQTTLPNRDPLVADNHLVDSGALLVFDVEATPGAGGPPRQLAVDQVRSQDPPEACGHRLEHAAGGRPGATLLVDGPWAGHETPRGDGVELQRTPPGTYCTSMWLALAEHHAEWAERYETVILHDTDPRSGSCASAVLRSTAAASGPDQGPSR
jgi:hypothetical protein